MPERTYHADTNAAAVNKDVDESSRRFARQPEPPPTAVSADGMWVADDRRGLIRANDYPTSGAWLVTVDGVTVGSVRPKYSGARTKRWTALINGMPILGGRAFPSRDKATIQILLEHQHLQDQVASEGRRGHRASRATPPGV